MPFDYAARQPRIAQVLRADAGTHISTSDFLRSAIDSGHRRQFFIDNATALRGRGQTLFNQSLKPNFIEERARVQKSHWQALCAGRPLSLKTVLKLDPILMAFAEHSDQSVRELTSVNGIPFVLSSASVVASIHYADPDELTEYRAGMGGAKREALSAEIFGHGRRYTLQTLERGDKGKHARLTSSTIDKMATVLGDGIRQLFTLDADAGPRRGENTFALPTAAGNLMSYSPVAIAA